MAETRMSFPEIMIFVFIAIVLILIPLFLAWLNSRITVNIEDNALRRASYEIAENLLNSGIAINGGFLLNKLNELDGTVAEPVKHCYAYRVTVTTQQKINEKNIWSFGFSGDDKFSVDLPVYIHASGIVPAKFNLKVFDTKEVRCGK